MNIIIVLVPLIGTIFGVMYYYNSKEFIELLLAQPIKRSSIFLGQYLGVAGSLTLSLVLGLGIPFVLYGLFKSDAIFDFSLLLVTGAFLTLIFTALSFLMSLIIFKEYPLDTFSLAATMFNPIDLSRTLILLKLDISALLGYTGAVFKQFFGTDKGLFISIFMLILWTIIPIWRLSFKAKRQDF